MIKKSTFTNSASCPAVAAKMMGRSGKGQPRRDAFTLIELIVVLAIGVLLSAAALPALVSVLQSRGLTQDIYGLSEMLDLARNEAISRETYVWVGIQPVTNNGTAELQVAAVASMDGTGNNTVVSNLIGISKVLYLQNVVLCQWSNLKLATQKLSTNYFTTAIMPLSVANNTTGVSFQAGTVQFTQKTTITFTPRGEALLPGSVSIATGYDPYIDVSLREAHGTQIAENADDASIVIDGATGATQMLRLQ